MNNLIKKVVAGMAVLMPLTAISASARVITFDDLPGYGDLIPQGYGGLNYGAEFYYYGGVQHPYYPNSNPNRAYNNDGIPEFYLINPTRFDGAYFAGYGSAAFELYRNNVLVHTSSTISLSDTPTFLASGYSGVVDKVRLLVQQGSFVIDDITLADDPTVVVNSVVINGSRPQTDSVVNARVTATGPKGSKLTYSYQWKKNGENLVGETGATLNLGKTGNGDRGDSITVEVRAQSGSLTSAPVLSPAVVVNNASPVVTSLALTPSAPNPGSVMNAPATATDPDGDAIRFVYLWYINGSEVKGEAGPALNLAKYGVEEGDQISVLVKARDYSAASAPVTSAPVTVVAAAPLLRTLRSNKAPSGGSS